MRKIADGLFEYEADHGGRLPPATQGRGKDGYFWTEAVRPYLVRAGYNPNSVLFCPAAIGRVSPSSYMIDPIAAGTIVRGAKVYSRKVNLTENAARHYGQPNTFSLSTE
jgi:hypothetical protein